MRRARPILILLGCIAILLQGIASAAAICVCSESDGVSHAVLMTHHAAADTDVVKQHHCCPDAGQADNSLQPACDNCDCQAVAPGLPASLELGRVSVLSPVPAQDAAPTVLSLRSDRLFKPPIF